MGCVRRTNIVFRQMILVQRNQMLVKTLFGSFWTVYTGQTQIFHALKPVAPQVELAPAISRYLLQLEFDNRDREGGRGRKEKRRERGRGEEKDQEKRKRRANRRNEEREDGVGIWHYFLI